MSREFDVRLEPDVMIPMRDGVRLATDLYRPASGEHPLPGPFPVLLERTPYNKKATSRSERTAANPTPKSRAEVAGYFAKRGYVVAYQDCRGRYGSEGRFTKYVGEAADGADAVEWLAGQPWCSGKVGTMGLSYAAHAQMALACLAPRGLAAMFVDSGGFSNAFQGGIRQGGAFELKQATWALKHARLSPEAQADPAIAAALDAEDVTAWFSRLPWRAGHSPLRWVPEYEEYLLEQWGHGVFDESWKRVGLYAAGYYDRIPDVPTAHVSSWYDAYARTATDNYAGLARGRRSPVRLILGPWVHGSRSQTYAGDVDFGSQATIDAAFGMSYLELRLRWFDRWLKGREPAAGAGAQPEPTVRYFVMGGGSGRRNAEGRMEHGGAWRSASDWPPPGMRATPWYLHGDGRLAPEPPAGDAQPLAYDHDPRHPVPSIGGTITSGEPVMVGGAFDQREEQRFFGSRPPYLPLASRPDVLVFQTGPLADDVEIAGPVIVRLWISSSCVDTDFTAKLIDVHPPNPDYPQGFAMNITDGILRARYRDSWEQPSLMAPGDVYAVSVEPFPTGNLFKAGHRIRLDISSSNFPHFDVNPNTGEPEGASRRTAIAVNRVFVDASRPSHVVLPVVPCQDR
jgi:uncharacterized protein